MCVSINVKVENNELYLSMVKYKKTCSLNQLMEHGTDTILMVKLLLVFLTDKERFEKVSFIDTSTFECPLESPLESTNNDTLLNNNFGNIIGTNEKYTIPINLLFHNLTIYGKTWYERHFNAIISDTKVAERVQTSIKNLKVLVDENSEIYERIFKTIQTTKETTESLTFTKVLNDVIKLMHQSIQVKTWMELFEDFFGPNGQISITHGKLFACSLYYMLDAGINELFGIPFECESLPMEISIETIHTYPEIKNLGINEHPSHKKSWGRAKKSKTLRLPKYISLSKYYTNRSLRRKAKK